MRIVSIIIQNLMSMRNSICTKQHKQCTDIGVGGQSCDIILITVSIIAYHFGRDACITRCPYMYVYGSLMFNSPQNEFDKNGNTVNLIQTVKFGTGREQYHTERCGLWANR